MNINIAFTISICINVFQAITFWFWTVMLICAYKVKKDECDKYEGGSKDEH